MNNERRFRPLPNGGDGNNDGIGGGVYDTNEMWVFDFTKLVWIELHFDSIVPRKSMLSIINQAFIYPIIRNHMMMMMIGIEICCMYMCM